MTALVTGASRGIGKVIAKQLALDGYDLALVGRDIQALNEVNNELSQYVNTLPIQVDLSDISACSRIVSEAAARFGGIDLLVNCAGISHKGSFTTVTPDE